MNYKRILIKNHNKTGIVSLNTPESLNVLESDTFQEIDDALNYYEKNNNIKIILLKSNCGMSKKGEKVFSCGVNLKEYDKKFECFDKDRHAFEIYLRQTRNLMTKIENFKKPVIIAIDGIISGGFFELALHCDLILASEKAVFSLNEVNLGLIPGYGGINKLLSITGKNKAFEIIASGKKINAKEAFELNIVSEIYKDSEFEEKTLKYCDKMAEKSSNALFLIKNTINNILLRNDAEDIEINNFLKAMDSEDSREGVRAFLEKRKPCFKQ